MYFHLQTTFSLTREDIPNKPDLFVESLRKIFGAGAKVIEEAIVKGLYSKLGMEYRERKNASFVDYLIDAREHKIKRFEHNESAFLR